MLNPDTFEYWYLTFRVQGLRGRVQRQGVSGAGVRLVPSRDAHALHDEPWYVRILVPDGRDVSKNLLNVGTQGAESRAQRVLGVVDQRPTVHAQPCHVRILQTWWKGLDQVDVQMHQLN